MRRTFFLIFLFAALNMAHAETQPYNRIEFHVDAAREVANDQVQAVMGVEMQDRLPAQVARQINATLNTALKIASASAGVKASSGAQNTHPVYGKNNQVDAWRGHAELRLESRDFKATGELIMLLQQHMQLRSLQFSLAPETRAKVENELITEALTAFRARADAIRLAMGAQSYRTVSLSINNGNGQPVPFPMLAMRSAGAMDAAIPAPELSAGDSRMTVQVSGMIELQ